MTESRIGLSGTGEEDSWPLWLLSTVFVGDHENFLNIDSGDGYTTFI